MDVKLYVGNLSYTTTEADLQTLFAKAGQVASVALIKDRGTGNSKGFAFVEMAQNSAADSAIKGINDTEMGGRNLKVNQAKPRGERAPRAPRW